MSKRHSNFVWTGGASKRLHQKTSDTAPASVVPSGGSAGKRDNASRQRAFFASARLKNMLAASEARAQAPAGGVSMDVAGLRMMTRAPPVSGPKMNAANIIKLDMSAPPLPALSDERTEATAGVLQHKTDAPPLDVAEEDVFKRLAGKLDPDQYARFIDDGVDITQQVYEELKKE